MREDADVRLFVQQALWFAPHLRDPTRRGVLQWILQFVEPGTHRVLELERRLRLHHPVQVAAEDAVVGLLERDLRVHRRTRRRAVRPGRSVDWPATFVASSPAVPHEYLNHDCRRVIDEDTIGALVALARSWADLLAVGEPDTRPRRQRLLRASEATRVAPRPYCRRHEARIRRLDPAACEGAVRIRLALRLLLDAFGDSDAVAYRSMAELLDSTSFANRDTLLETTVTLSIARAASMLQVGGEPEWRVEFPRGDPFAVRLESRTIGCKIYKGIPAAARANGRGYEDKLNASIRAMGLPVRGNQPDVVLEFYDRAHPCKRHYVLADAKRNHKHDGRDHLRKSIEVAAVYAVSYGHLIGLQFDPSSPFGLSTPVHPAVTLFCRQGPPGVAGSPAAEASVTLDRSRELPPIIALGLDHLLGREGEAWCSPTLEAWWSRVSRDAERVLRECSRGSGPQASVLAPAARR